MRLKKIELVGFKSFADREVIHMDDHVSAVVGPNGCGKSNIVDAIRWCMGEQSAKHLRGSGMADVIFAGSSARGPAGMAEVTLTFETGPEIPETYREFPELGITRRLFSDGTSEYLINKIPARLRDITDLLMGTGSGTKGYAIIEQGQIGRIVSSKPEQRRHIIDEAAGITRFKAQKQAAERKITATRQNLLRVTDVLGELEQRLGSLRRQAQKAERYKRYRGELRDLDLWLASHSFLELESLRAVLGERRADLGQQVEDVRNELAAREAALEAKRAELKTVDEALAEQTQNVWSLDNRLKLLEKDAEHRAREGEELKTRTEDSRHEASVAARRVDDLETEVREVVGAQERLGDGDGDDGEQATVSRLEAAHARASTHLEEERTALEAARAEHSELTASLASKQARLQAQTEAVEREQARLDASQADLQALVDSEAADVRTLADAREGLASADAEVERIQGRRGELDRERVALRDRIAASEVDLDTKRAEVVRCRSRIQSLEEIQQRYRSCHSGVQVVMEHREELGAEAQAELGGGSSAGSASEGPVYGIMADYISAPQHLEAAVSAVLGDRLQGVVVDGPSAGARGVALLKDKQEGRTAFLPRAVREAAGSGEAAKAVGWSPADAREGGESIEVVDLSGTGAGTGTGTGTPRLPGIVGRLMELVEVDAELGALARVLLGDTVVVDGLARALELWQGGDVRTTMVTLDGDRVEPSGVVVGGSSDALDSALLQQKRELKELGDVLRELEESLESTSRRHHGLAERRAEVESAREAIEGELLAAEKARLERAQAVDQLQQSIEGKGVRRTALAAEVAQLETARDAARDEVGTLRGDLELGRRRLPELDQAAVDRQERIAGLIEEQGDLAAKLTDAKIALAKWQQQADALASTRDRLERQIAAERERAARLEQSATDAEARIVELEAAAVAAEKERVELVEASRAASEKESEAREQRDALRVEVDRVDAAIHNLRTQLDGERESLTEVDMGLQENELERQHLERDISERFDVELRGVLVDYHDRALAGDTERSRQTDLKRIISRMGEVNLTAIDEFDEVSERFEYLSGQRTDLESAIAQLQEAIDRIDKTTRQRFKDTFAAINERFKQVFPRLFSGGRAELQMSDPHDLLNTGVEIVAQPPGKQLRSLDLLSGGEKALTAVSLIFAIFLIKPSPFCLLDEVDAPLDDANVGRFCALVRELAETTQFIIITHNKLTMEIANRLYGVTMQQRGVSKLVSVNMRHAVELAYS